ncbi:MAG: phosphotransferase family protein [Acidimicrobiia bacterium]
MAQRLPEPLKIPPTWDDVTAEWLDALLAPRFPGARVADVEMLTITDGTNRRARVGATYSAGTGPAVVFLKAEGVHREIHARNGNLFNEPRLAASGVPLPVDHPAPYGVLIDEEGLDWLVAMEDVTQRGADPRDSTRPMTVEQATNGVLGLARLHRDYWGFTHESHPALDWVQTWAPTEGFQSGLRARVPTGLERAGADIPPEVARLDGDELLDLWARYVSLLAADPVTLLHADAHIGNTYVLPDDDVGFLDWQVARRGNWSQDVGYFFQGAVVEEDRRAAERDVVDAYVAELGCGLDPTDAWTWYRASAVYGLVIWLSTLGAEGFQTGEVSLALTRRYAEATVELEALDALAELESRVP